MILMRVGNQETTIHKKVRAIEQIFVLDPYRMGEGSFFSLEKSIAL